MPISGVNFYSMHARDLPQKKGFGGGGIKYFCFLPLSKFDLQ